MEKVNGKWVDELPLTLWAYQTTHKSVTGFSPFALAYGLEAMIPVELDVHSHRDIHYNPQTNEQLLLESLDMIDEKLDEACLRVAAHQNRVV